MLMFANTMVDYFGRWSIVDWYLKIVGNFNDGRHCLSKIEGLNPPCHLDDDLINLSSTKIREKEYACFKTQLISVFTCFCQTDTDQVIVSIVRTRRTESFYFRGTSSIAIRVLRSL